MQDGLIKRRVGVSKTNTMSLVHKLVILLRSRKEIRMFCTSTSLAMRLTILCQMAIENKIGIEKSGLVYVINEPNNAIEKEFAYKIGEKKQCVKELIGRLNGEFEKKNGVTNLRMKIYKEMEAKNLIKFNKGHFFKSIKIDNIQKWYDIFFIVIEDALNPIMEIENEILLLGLDYINNMQELIVQCNEKHSVNLKKRVNEIKEKILNNKYPKENTLVYKILKEYLN